MTTNHVPAGWPTLIPRLSVSDPENMVGFLKGVFKADGEYVEGRPSEIRLGESMVMVGGIVERRPTRSSLYLYVADVDGTFARALSAGSEAIEAPEEMPYGDRRAMFRDPWENHWQIATHRGFKE